MPEGRVPAITRLLAAAGCADVADFRRRGAADPDWLWRTVLRQVDVHWSRPFRAVYDDSLGQPWRQWFIGGQLNVVESCLERHAATRPAAAALVWDGADGVPGRWSFGELQGATDALAAELTRAGVREGQGVGLCVPPSPEGVAATLAVAKLGAVLVPLTHVTDAAALAARLRRVRAVALLLPDPAGGVAAGRAAALGRAAAGHCPQLRGLLTVVRPTLPREDTGPSPRTRHVASEHPLFVAFPPDGEVDDATVHVHGGWLVQTAAAIALHADCGPGDVVCWPTAPGSIMGPWHLFGALANGACVALYGDAQRARGAERLAAFAARHGVTILALDAAAARSLRAGRWAQRADLGRLRLIAATGEGWDARAWSALARIAAAHAVALVRMYAEAPAGGPLLATYPTDRATPDAVGGAACGMALDVRDERGEAVARGQLASTAAWPAMTRGLHESPLRFLVRYWSRWPGAWAHGRDAALAAGGQLVLQEQAGRAIAVGPAPRPFLPLRGE